MLFGEVKALWLARGQYAELSVSVVVNEAPPPPPTPTPRVFLGGWTVCLDRLNRILFALSKPLLVQQLAC